MVESKAPESPTVAEFEHVIVASGFFGKPKIPKGDDGAPLIKGSNVCIPYLVFPGVMS